MGIAKAAKHIDYYGTQAVNMSYTTDDLQLPEKSTTRRDLKL